MKIQQVGEEQIPVAAKIHALSWKESHQSFCSKEFIEIHTIEHQMQYLKSEMQKGKELYVLQDIRPIGIVSIMDNFIENLYILPKEQAKGYGSKLLQFAEGKCKGEAKLTVLDCNEKAIRLYKKHGYIKTGKKTRLSDLLYEIEMVKKLV